MILTFLNAFFPVINKIKEKFHSPNKHQKNGSSDNGCRREISWFGVFFEIICFTKKMFRQRNHKQNKYKKASQMFCIEWLTLRRLMSSNAQCCEIFLIRFKNFHFLILFLILLNGLGHFKTKIVFFSFLTTDFQLPTVYAVT